ncbi:MAG TPA: YciI family protein [Baekduia sp.]|nr:YciI family protein [Baekduia sp.]
MKYMLLLYVPEEVRNDPAARASMEEWLRFGAELKASGADLGNNALQGLETAATVRVRDGETLVSDGPFAETKEMLGGYYIVDVADRDAAIRLAADVPCSPYGTVEIRPVMEPPEAP